MMGSILCWKLGSNMHHVIGPFCIPDPWGFLEGLKKSQKQLEIVVGTFFWPNAPFLDFFFFGDFLGIFVANHDLETYVFNLSKQIQGKFLAVTITGKRILIYSLEIKNY